MAGQGQPLQISWAFRRQHSLMLTRGVNGSGVEESITTPLDDFFFPAPAAPPGAFLAIWGIQQSGIITGGSF